MNDPNAIVQGDKATGCREYVIFFFVIFIIAGLSGVLLDSCGIPVPDKNTQDVWFYWI